MSNMQVCAAVEQMEAWLTNSAWEPDADALAQWNAGLQRALATAEHGPGWAELAERAHAAGRLLEARSAEVAVVRDRIKAELDSQGRGTRALRGYGASAR